MTINHTYIFTKLTIWEKTKKKKKKWKFIPDPPTLSVLHLEITVKIEKVSKYLLSLWEKKILWTQCKLNMVNITKKWIIIQIYPVSEGYLRKILVERRGKYPEQSGSRYLPLLSTSKAARDICLSSQPVFFANNPHKQDIFV